MQQLTFPGVGEAAALADPAFSSNKRRPLHRWVNWIAGFSADFVASTIERYLGSADPASACVLDPFAGVGTTLVEALRRRFGTVGFEINPFAALAARLKLACVRLDLATFEAAMATYDRRLGEVEAETDAAYRANGSTDWDARLPQPASTPPRAFRSRVPFFSPPVLRKVLFTLDYVRGLREGDPLIADIFRLAFGATMVGYSNYTYEPSLGSRPGSGKALIDNASVRLPVVAKLSEMLADAAELQTMLSRGAEPALAAVHAISFFRAPECLQPQSIDLVVTSPPYLNNYHYPRNTRPQVHWLFGDDAARILRQMETESFGTFWQTVRDLPPIALHMEHAGLTERLAALRSVSPGRGAYSGAGWANYATTYFNDAYRFFHVLWPLLKPGAHAVIVVGNSLLKGIEFAVDRILADLARVVGFDATVEIVRASRVGSSIVGTGLRSKPHGARAALYEAAVILHKPPGSTARSA